jgi:hypothetical protein
MAIVSMPPLSEQATTLAAETCLRRTVGLGVHKRQGRNSLTLLAGSQTPFRTKRMTYRVDICSRVEQIRLPKALSWIWAAT